MDFYHVLNRGVDKRDIFLENSDYQRFVDNLKLFNSSTRVDHNRYRSNTPERHPTSLRGVGDEHLVYIHAFCLMPNHYHLLLSPAVENGMPLFMKKLNMGYSKYFNERYQRSGALFQGKYKSILIDNDAHFLHIPLYIHLNPLDLQVPEWRERSLHDPHIASDYLSKYRWSSHRDYLGNPTFSEILHKEALDSVFEEAVGYSNIFKSALQDFTLENPETSGIYLE